MNIKTNNELWFKRSVTSNSRLKILGRAIAQTLWQLSIRQLFSGFEMLETLGLISIFQNIDLVHNIRKDEDYRDFGSDV